MDRRLTGRALPLALAVLALAGCAAPAAPVPTQHAPPGDAPAADAAGPDRKLVWSGCRGATVTLNGPSPLYPSSAPAGWGPGVLPLTEVRLVLLQCDRVSWGPFERGPVSIAQEWRDDFEAPAACKGLGSEWRYLLESIWFSDADLAAHAAAQGMPARAAEFAAAFDAAAQEWAWGPAGEPPSTALVAGFDANTVRQGWTRRLLWADGEGVGALDLTDNVTASPTAYAASGALRPPTLYGRANAAPEFASATASLVRTLEATGELHRFGDTSCEQPL